MINIDKKLNNNNFSILEIIILISFLYFYIAINLAKSKNLWMDEVISVSIARQPSLSDVWDAIWSRGTDFTPPFYHIIIKYFNSILGQPNSRLVWRLPSIIAVYGSAICVYNIVKNTFNKYLCILSFLMVLSFSLFEFAIDARVYGILSFCFSFSLLLWNDYDNSKNKFLNAFTIWLMISSCIILHFYSITFLMVFGVAEAAYVCMERKIRIPVLVALLGAIPVEIAVMPIASHLSRFLKGEAESANFYGKPTLGKFLEAAYDIILGGQRGSDLLIAGLALIFLIHFSRYIIKHNFISKFINYDYIVVINKYKKIDIIIFALFSLPFIVFLLSFLITHSFSERYMACAALLPAIAVPRIIDTLPARGILSVCLIILTLVVLFDHGRASDQDADILSVLKGIEPDRPIVVGEGLLYIELMEAASDPVKAKLVYLLHTPGTVSPDPTNEDIVQKISIINPNYKIFSKKDFLNNNDKFYIIYRTNNSTDTTTPYLIKEKFNSRPVVLYKDIVLFSIEK